MISGPSWPYRLGSLLFYNRTFPQGSGTNISQANTIRPAPSRTVTLAVMSDMHCRLSSDAVDSFLEVGSTRLPVDQHPISALIELFKREGMSADAVLLPGDLTNKARREGLSQSWDYALEVRSKLGARCIIPTLGNHDVDSRRTDPDKEPFYNARNLREDFPFLDLKSTQAFFSDGFCIYELDQDIQIVAINTVIDHHDEQSAKRGAFDPSRIDRLKKALAERGSVAIRIAMMHHHPVVHSGVFFSDKEVIPTGDKLLAALRENGCALALHGHKHHARLAIVDGLPVFACGSFSANLGVFASAMSNMFHMVTLEESAGHVRGRINTWVFHYGSGWGPARAEHSGFPFLTGFGRQLTTDQLGTVLLGITATEASKDRFRHPDIIAAAPDLQFLTPSELRDLQQTLRLRGFELSDNADGKLELWRIFAGD
jgi:predicted phosphodiesterase